MDIDYSATAILHSALQIMDERNIAPLASVLDVGCGDGQWLAAAHNLLMDGPLVGADLPHHAASTWKTMTAEGVQKAAFVPVDLNALTSDTAIGDAAVALSTPLTTLKYDLVVCVEVAEHLQPGTEKGLVQLLTMMAGKGVILWSAAQPGQGPYDPDDPTNPGAHHNERWPWEWEALFKTSGFELADLIRPEIWTDQRIDWWYRMSTVLYVNPKVIAPWQDELVLISRTILRDLAQAASLRGA